MRGPSPRQLFAETAKLAHRLHWSLDVILDLEHPDRRRFLNEVDRLDALVPAGGERSS
jgi:hypothetical protein